MSPAIIALSVLLVAFALPIAFADDESERGGRGQAPGPADRTPLEPPEITSETEAAIRAGLDYLAAHQDPEHGYWVEMVGRKVNDEYKGHLGRHVGVTALACMSFLANGSTPGRGRYGAEVEKGLTFILDCVKPTDGFITSDESRMYSHAFATLFLAEVYGMTGDPRIEPKLQSAIDCIVRSQNDQGGWRYLPGADDSDMSVTVCQVMALRGARNVGIYVPKSTIERAITYVKASYIDDYGNPALHGGFWYQVFDQPFRRSRTSFALTAAGVTALYGAGEYDSEEVREGLKFLFHHRWRPQAYKMRRSFDYWYGHYYAIQAFYQAGGEYWQRWYPDIRDEILAGQNPREGYWEDLVGRNYATAMATIILQIPYRYLPIFER